MYRFAKKFTSFRVGITQRKTPLGYLLLSIPGIFTVFAQIMEIKQGLLNRRQAGG